jgi:Toluene-4-monooxygenase system protein B (TmoB)
MPSFSVRGSFESSALTWIVEVDDTDLLTTVAEKFADTALGLTASPQSRPMRAWHNGTPLELTGTVADAGIAAMDILRVAYA